MIHSAPTGCSTRDTLQHVDGPVDLSAGGVEHAQIAAGAERVDAVPLDGGRRTRTIAAIVAEPGAMRRFPEALAGGGIKGDARPRVLARAPSEYRRPPEVANDEYPSPAPVARQASGGPPAGQVFSSPVSADRPSRFGPRHCGQSSKARFETAAGRAARRATVTRATDGRLRLGNSSCMLPGFLTPWTGFRFFLLLDPDGLLPEVARP